MSEHEDTLLNLKCNRCKHADDSAFKPPCSECRDDNDLFEPDTIQVEVKIDGKRFTGH